MFLLVFDFIDARWSPIWGPKEAALSELDREKPVQSGVRNSIWPKISRVFLGIYWKTMIWKNRLWTFSKLNLSLSTRFKWCSLASVTYCAACFVTLLKSMPEDCQADDLLWHWKCQLPNPAPFQGSVAPHYRNILEPKPCKTARYTKFLQSSRRWHTRVVGARTWEHFRSLTREQDNHVMHAEASVSGTQKQKQQENSGDWIQLKTINWYPLILANAERGTAARSGLAAACSRLMGACNDTETANYGMYVQVVEWNQSTDPDFQIRSFAADVSLAKWEHAWSYTQFKYHIALCLMILNWLCFQMFPMYVDWFLKQRLLQTPWRQCQPSSEYEAPAGCPYPHSVCVVVVAREDTSLRLPRSWADGIVGQNWRDFCECIMMLKMKMTKMMKKKKMMMMMMVMMLMALLLLIRFWCSWCSCSRPLMLSDGIWLRPVLLSIWSDRMDSISLQDTRTEWWSRRAGAGN